MLKSLNDRALFKLCKKTTQSWYLNRNSPIICNAAYVKKAEIARLMLATTLETTDKQIESKQCTWLSISQINSK